MKDIKTLYIHYPHCENKCNYCDFFSRTKGFDKFEYQKQLLSQIQELEILNEKKQSKLSTLDNIFVGGGTPSLWGVGGATFINENIISKYGISKNYEYTFELNPHSITTNLIDGLTDNLANRFSVGVQALNNKLLDSLSRIHDRDMAIKSLKSLKGLNYSADLMLGLPYSKVIKRNIIDEAKTLLDLGVKHISAYILTVNDSYTHFEEIPDDKYIEEEYLALADFLSGQGMNHYEVSNFGYSGFESSHNLAYWKSDSYMAIGPSAAGLINSDKFTRYKWNVDGTLELEELSSESVWLEKLYMRFRTNLGTPVHMFNKFDNFDDWVSRGLIIQKDGLIYPTSRGYLLLDSLLNEVF